MFFGNWKTAVLIKYMYDDDEKVDEKPNYKNRNVALASN